MALESEASPDTLLPTAVNHAHDFARYYPAVSSQPIQYPECSIGTCPLWVEQWGPQTGWSKELTAGQSTTNTIGP